MKALWYSSLFIVLSGCVVRQSIQKNKHALFAQKTLLAKFGNIPDLPLHARLQTVSYDIHHPDQIHVRYVTDDTNDIIIEYYQKNMERLGWSFVGISTIDDVCLQFSKPDVLCTVIIVKDVVTVFVVKKKDL